MGGYMGFGMARWIYTQRPRKAFAKHKRMPTCNTLPSYNRKFKLQPSNQQSSRLYIIISFIVIGLTLIIVLVKGPRFIEYSNHIENQKKEYAKQLDDEAFNFLMRSGLTRLKSNNLVGAYSEFKLAYSIYPDNEEINRLITETVSSLCMDNNTYCDDLDRILSQLD